MRFHGYWDDVPSTKRGTPPKWQKVWPDDDSRCRAAVNAPGRGGYYRCTRHGLGDDVLCTFHRHRQADARGTAFVPAGHPPRAADPPYEGLSVRTANVLGRNGLTRDAVRTIADDDLMGYRNLGNRALRELRRLLPYAGPPAPEPPAWLIIC